MSRCLKCRRSSGYSNIYKSLKKVSSPGRSLFITTPYLLLAVTFGKSSLIYHQLPEGNKWADDHDEGTGEGSLRYNDLYAIVFCRSTFDFNSVLVTFSPSSVPNHLLLLKVVWYKKNLFSPIWSCGKLWSKCEHVDPSHAQKNKLIGSAVAMATYWCILLLGFSAFLLSTDISIVTEGRWKEILNIIVGIGYAAFIFHSYKANRKRWQEHLLN